MKFLFILIFLITSVSVFADKEWTVMVFLNGDNNLDSYAFGDLNEMEDVGSNEWMNIVVQYDRYSSYGEANWSTTRRFYVEQDYDRDTIGSTMVEDIGEIDSGDYNEVVDFVRWSKQNYPAQKYALIIWNHGSGWDKKNLQENILKGISYDDTNGGHISVVNGEYETMLSEIETELGQPLDFLGSDACLMAMWEVMYVSKTHAKYYAGSEETESGDGWDFSTLFQNFVNGTHSAENFCRQVSISSINSVGSTLSCVNLQVMDELDTALENFASHYTTDTSLDSLIISAANNSTTFEADSSKDLGEFMQYLSDYTTDNTHLQYITPVLTALDQFVIENNTLGSYSDAMGVAIYLPIMESYDTTYNSGSWSVNTHWDDFIKREFSLQQDSYEPDNDFSTATINSDFSDQVHNFHNASDEDFTKFSLIGGQSYSFITNCGTSDTVMELYNSSEQLILENDDTNGRCSQIDYTPTSNGDIYIKVYYYDHNNTGDYILTITTGGTVEDDHPNYIDGVTENDQLLSIQTAEINYEDDIDYFYLDLDPGEYNFETEAGSLSDTILYLYDQNGDLLEENDDREGGGYTSQIIYNFTYSQRVYVAVKGYSDNTGTYTLKYEVSSTCEVTNNGVEICDNGIDEDCDGLTDMDDPDCASGACTEGYCDAYANTHCEEDENGEPGCYCNDGYVVNEAGDACIPIADCTDDGLNNNSVETATVINLPYTDTHHSCTTANDFFLVTLSAGDEFQITLNGFDTSETDIDLYLLDSEENEVGSSAGLEYEEISGVIETTGDYYIVVFPYNTVDSDYTLSVTLLNVTDPCAGVSCSGYGTCVNNNGVASCNCDDGYHAEGLNCVEDTVDPCLGVTCSNHGSCIEENGEAICNCDDGYHAEGLSCVENSVTDPCEGVLCSGHGICVEENDTAVCVCDSGYHMDGLNCIEDIVDLCEGITCSNHGTCTTQNDEAVCVCDDGYHAEGLECVENSVIDPCEGVTCSNHGTCTVQNDEAVCTCDDGYHAEGLSCIEDIVDPCEGVTCSDNSHCEEGSCICDEGYHEEDGFCVENSVTDPCEGVSCSNHGECIDNNGRASCVCDDGYHNEGLNCVENSVTDPCEGVTCSDHGTCSVENNTAVCTCDEGFEASGLNCIPDIVEPSGSSSSSGCSYNNYGNSNGAIFLLLFGAIFIFITRKFKHLI